MKKLLSLILFVAMLIGCSETGPTLAERNKAKKFKELELKNSLNELLLSKKVLTVDEYIDNLRYYLNSDDPEYKIAVMTAKQMVVLEAQLDSLKKK